MEREAAELAAQVKDSPKYAPISDELVQRLCQEYAGRYKSKKEAVKAVKRQLHIIHGAFFPDKCHEAAMELIRNASCSDRELSLALMELHPSTRERLSSMEAFYGLLSPYLTNAKSVWDIGCGFHPCALPFMGLNGNVLYKAGDIDHGTVEVIGAFFHRLQITAEVQILDAAGNLPDEAADVVFLFKLVPVLEQQKKGLAYRMMERIRARALIVTFPVRSLSGRDKDMEAFYSGQFETNLPKSFTILEKQVVGTELVYVISSNSLS